MIYAGIDAGSRAIKVVVIKDGQIVAKGQAEQGIEQGRLAGELFDSVLQEAGIDRPQVRYIVATGYGRNAVSIADTCVTEITCQSLGVSRLVPQARTIIDIGGQDSKLIRLDLAGRVQDFAMNDRCAAGTGRFLEVVAHRLSVPIARLGEAAHDCKTPAPISSMCVVFAETEIIGLLAAGRPAGQIVAGVQRAIASRILAMAGRELQAPVVFTGGVAMIKGMDQALQTACNKPVEICPLPQFSCALGAAIMAQRIFEQEGGVPW
ncbi:MAG: acyl-CoA dehydratase activase [Sedimentisphaerales bacterium]|nr:acyl-CoA dehydratase activase [Sedimentisphaerales bacterium]